MSAGTVASLGQALLTIGANAVPATSTLTKFRGFVEGIGEEINSMGNKFALAGGAIKATTALIAGKSIGTLSSIEHASHEAMLIAGKTKETWKPVDDMIEKIGISTIYTQVQVADAVRTIAQAGYSEVAQLEPMINNAQSLALALGTDMKSASGVMISAMESFKGLGGTTENKLRNITDMLGNVAAASRIDFPDLQAFMQQLTGMVNLEDANPKEILAAFGAINQVMGNGAMAAAGLRQGWDMLNRMSVRSDFTKEILPTLKEMGLTANDVNPRIVGLTEAVKRLGEAGMFKNAKASLWFGVQGKNALGLLANNIGMTQKITSEMDRMGSVASRASTMIDSLWGRGMKWASLIEQMWKKLGEGLLEAGVDKMVKDATAIFEKFVEWIAKNKVVVGQVIIAFSKLGGVLLAVGTGLKLIGGLVSLVAGLFSVKGMIWVAVFALFASWIQKNADGLRRFKKDAEIAFGALSRGDFASAFAVLKQSADENIPILGKVLDLVTQIGNAASTMFGRSQKGEDLLQKSDKDKTQKDYNPVLGFLETAREKWNEFSTWIQGKFTALGTRFQAIWGFADGTLAEKIEETIALIGDELLSALTMLSKSGAILNIGLQIGEGIMRGLIKVLDAGLAMIDAKFGETAFGKTVTAITAVTGAVASVGEYGLRKVGTAQEYYSRMPTTPWGNAGITQDPYKASYSDRAFEERAAKRAKAKENWAGLYKSLGPAPVDKEAVSNNLWDSIGSPVNPNQLATFFAAQKKVPSLTESNVAGIADASVLNSQGVQDKMRELKIKGTVLEVEGSKLALLITGTQEFIDGVNRAQGKSLKAVALGTRP